MMRSGDSRVAETFLGSPISPHCSQIPSDCHAPNRAAGLPGSGAGTNMEPPHRGQIPEVCQPSTVGAIEFVGTTNASTRKGRTIRNTVANTKMAGKTTKPTSQVAAARTTGNPKIAPTIRIEITTWPSANRMIPYCERIGPTQMLAPKMIEPNAVRAAVAAMARPNVARAAPNQPAAIFAKNVIAVRLTKRCTAKMRSVAIGYFHKRHQAVPGVCSDSTKSSVCPP